MHDSLRWSSGAAGVHNDSQIGRSRRMRIVEVLLSETFDFLKGKQLNFVVLHFFLLLVGDRLHLDDEAERGALVGDLENFLGRFIPRRANDERKLSMVDDVLNHVRSESIVNGNGWHRVSVAGVLGDQPFQTIF